MATYNRYIPQSDGSYRKNRISEQQPQKPPAPPPAPEPPKVPSPSHGGSVSGFLKNLLPIDFDTGDLLVVLLLLLMAEHGDEDKSTALLTLALYFIM